MSTTVQAVSEDQKNWVLGVMDKKYDSESLHQRSGDISVRIRWFQSEFGREGSRSGTHRQEMYTNFDKTVSWAKQGSNSLLSYQKEIRRRTGHEILGYSVKGNKCKQILHNLTKVIQAAMIVVVWRIQQSQNNLKFSE